MNGVEIVGLSVCFGTDCALQDVSLTFSKSSFALILGANGSGKTVLLHALVGLHRARSGAIVVDGQPLSGPRPDRIGFLFQQSQRQVLALSVAEDVAIAPRALGWPEQRVMQAVQKTAADLGIESLLDRSPAELSGGQLRRVALAGALVTSPAYLVLDEPFLELDYPATCALVETLRRFRAGGGTIIAASHDYRSVWKLTDQIVVLRAGAVVCSAPPDVASAHITTENGLEPWNER